MENLLIREAKIRFSNDSVVYGVRREDCRQRQQFCL